MMRMTKPKMPQFGEKVKSGKKKWTTKKKYANRRPPVDIAAKYM